MDTAEILERAADLLWVRGRARGGLIRGEELCPLGAIAVVAGIAVEELDESTYAALRAMEAPMVLAGRLGAQWGDSLDRVWRWNDRTDDDFVVTDTLRRCAKDLRNEAT